MYSNISYDEFQYLVHYENEQFPIRDRAYDIFGKLVCSDRFKDIYNRLMEYHYEDEAHLYKIWNEPHKIMIFHNRYLIHRAIELYEQYK